MSTTTDLRMSSADIPQNTSGVQINQKVLYFIYVYFLYIF